jgi:hypothetical protein
MSRRYITLLVIVAIPITLVYCLSLRADPPRNASEDLFSGKILMVTQRTTPNSSAVLEEVHVTRIGDQTFLVGKGVDEDKGSWYNGRTIWIPLPEVNQILEFTDRGDLSKANDARRTATK